MTDAVGVSERLANAQGAGWEAAAPGRPPRRRGRRGPRLRREAWLGLGLTVPTLIAVLAVILLPILSALYLSLQRRDLARPFTNAFVGMANFRQLFRDPAFINSLQVSTIFSVSSVVLEVVLGVAIALVLNERFAGRGLVRGLIILPWALPAIVNAAMWDWIYNSDYGALNALLTQTGVQDQYRVWLADPAWATWLLILANVWKETPFTVLLVLAALQGIPTELHEAARVDGASVWHRLRYVTLPLVMPAIRMAALLQLIWGFHHTFELAIIITGGGPASATDLVPLRIYAETFRSLRFGYGSAMATFVGVALFVPALFYIRNTYRKAVQL